MVSSSGRNRRPSAKRLRDVGLLHPHVVGRDDPERELHPLADAGLGQPLGSDPDEVDVPAHTLARLEQLRERRRFAGRVVNAGAGALDRGDDPLAEVAHVDELHRRVGRCRREHAAALGDPARPVGEAVGRVVRTDDQAGPSDERAFAERIQHDSLAGRLQRAVVLDALRVGVLELRDR